MGSKRESSGLAAAEAKGGGWAGRASGALARKREQPEAAWRCLIFKLWEGEEGVEGAHRSGDLGSLSRALASLSPPPGLGGAVEGRAGREGQLGASHKLLREPRREEGGRESLQSRGARVALLCHKETCCWRRPDAKAEPKPAEPKSHWKRKAKQKRFSCSPEGALAAGRRGFGSPAGLPRNGFVCARPLPGYSGSSLPGPAQPSPARFASRAGAGKMLSAFARSGRADDYGPSSLLVSFCILSSKAVGETGGKKTSFAE